MLDVKHLKCIRDGKTIIHDISLNINPGEIHAIMGPNGSGKSTFVNALAGLSSIDVAKGSALLNGIDILELTPDKRAQAGLFLGFQYPVEIPGVNNMYFIKTALNSIRISKGLEALDAYDMLELIKSKAKQINFDEKYLQRGFNEGFSGGEKKRNEILQMLVLEPQLALLDEIDSGLDIDALVAISKGINLQRESGRSAIIVTHYQRLLDHVKPDHVHVLMDGKIVESGDMALVSKLENQGYQWLNNDS